MSIRVRTTPNGGDKYLKVNLEQEFDFIEILSLKISQEDVYRKFCSDYGVIVGRVTVNNGFGVPNARVSVFIPLDDVDKNNPEIKGLYPYEVVTDKNEDGVRYNLLPKDSAPENDCFTPIGTFPNKREVLDNDTMLDIYCKYYKFTTTTNHAGDFMIFGVPLGTYTVHLDADVSDIGILSQRPYDLINQGTPLKAFDSPTKFKGGNNLDKLIQIKSVNVGVNVEPFWGDKDNCAIGITRLDIPLNHTVTPSAIFMGSTFGDSDKNSINKNCRPRKKLGTMCEQVTGEGTINMIRKTIDGEIEFFDVEGGRVIDENGAWAYQIPMNLEYKTTNENGDLIDSKDPNVGIPTKASVRFKIAMDETGGEGRLRTRAKYLVPHNPQNTSEIDYRFGPATNTGPATKDSSFKDLSWNKIYSTSNYIPRFQTDFFLGIGSIVDTEAFTGIKDVDACGDKTPFPYNRVDTDINPIFFIICIIMEIISLVIFLINLIIIPIVNLVIWLLNLVVSFVCILIDGINSVLGWVGADFDPPSFCTNGIPYIQCVQIECESGSGKFFAPGCFSGPSPFFAGFNSLPQAPTHYPDDGHSHSDIDVGLVDCIAFQLAKALNMFKLHFYNDWINGTLFSYLLKYKKKRKKAGSPTTEKFCEYECKSGNFTPTDGTNDNNCHGNHIVDTCFDIGDDSQKAYHKYDMTDGLIKEVDGEFFYAATTHGVQQKLFATDIISLGPIYNCDWQSQPKINDLLVPTTYKIPPDSDEYNASNTLKETCGMVSLGQANTGLFFSINCFGLHVDGRQCMNIRHLCEFGVDINETVNNANADCIIGVKEIDDDFGAFFRDVFYGLNNGTQWSGVGNWNTNFNLTNASTYDFSAFGPNGFEYSNFRGISNNGSVPNTDHSYFFYFGTVPGKSGLEKMNSNYFTTCERLAKDSMIIQSSSVSDTSTGSTCNGSIVFSFVGGSNPITWTIVGPNYMNNGSTTANVSITLNNLCEGQYVIEGTDSVGTLVEQTVSVGGIDDLSIAAEVTTNCVTSVSTDGSITITSVFGGVGPYTYELFDNNGNLVSNGPCTTPTVIGGLIAQYNPSGYTVTVTDSVGDTDTVVNLVVTGPEEMIVTTSKIDIDCFGGNTGQLNIGVIGGVGPFTLLTTGPNITNLNKSLSQINGLVGGIYTTTVTDNSPTPQVATTTTTIYELSPQIVLTPNTTPDPITGLIYLNKQCDPTQHTISVTLDYITGLFTAPSALGPYMVELEYKYTSPGWISAGSPIPWVDNATYIEFYIPPITIPFSDVRIRAKFTNINGVVCYSADLPINQSVIELPPAVLAITPINITKQCSVGSADIGVTINNYPMRAPFTVVYSINGIQNTRTINNATDTWTVSGVSTNQPILFTVTDNVGCTATTSQNVVTPSTPLSSTSLTRSALTMGSGAYVGQYKYELGNTAIGGTIGGIGTVTTTVGGYSLPYTFYNFNLITSIGIIDSVGCTAIITNP